MVNAEKRYVVYVHKNKINGKVYIGITCQGPERRWRNGDGYKGCPHFMHAIQRYGWDNFEHIICAENLPSSEAVAMEMELIAKYDSRNPDKGYNMTAGGEGWNGCTRIVTEEMRKRMSEAHKGKQTGKDNPFYGRHHSKETKEKLSAAKKGRNVGEKNPFYGKHHAEENKALRKAVSQFTLDEKWIADYSSMTIAEKETEVNSRRIGQCCLGKIESAGGFFWTYKLSDDEKANFVLPPKKPKKETHVALRKAVSQFTLDGEWVADYVSMAVAAEETGISKTCICYCCKGKSKSAGGFIWKYKS